MKIRLVLLLCLVLLLVSGCVDKSKPWKDDSGHWHEKYVCIRYAHTSYTDIPIGKYGHMYIPHTTYDTECEYE